MWRGMGAYWYVQLVSSCNQLLSTVAAAWRVDDDVVVVAGPLVEVVVDVPSSKVHRSNAVKGLLPGERT